MVRYCERTLRSKEKSHSSSVQSSMVPACTKPAPLKSTSTAPVRGGGGLIGGGVGDVEPRTRAAAFGPPATASSASLMSVAITRAPSRTKASGDGAADALAGGGDEGGLALRVCCS